MAKENKNGVKNVNNKNNIKPKVAKFNSANVDKAKVNKILKELNEIDDVEEINKNIEKQQADTKEAADPNTYVPRSERIKQKNEELMEQVFRQNRKKTDEIAEKQKENINVILTILLFLLLIATLVMGVFLYLQKITSYDEDYIRVSVSMTNKDIFYETHVEGDLIPKTVSPGDKFKLNIIAKNANAITGDVGDDWTNIYIRFRLFLKIDGVEYPDFIHIEPNSEYWEKYNKELEDTYTMTDETGNIGPVVKRDDGYYYCKLILKPNEQVTVIDWLRFSETYITEIVGRSNAVLEVAIEALDATVPQVIKDRTIWYDAPQHWVELMSNPDLYDADAEANNNPKGTVNVWWIILFIVIAVLLIITLIYFTTRKKTSKRKIADMNRKINRKP